MLSPDQENARDVFIKFLHDPEHKVMVLTGSPGTGKSYLTDHLIKVAQQQIELLNTLCNGDKELNVAVTASTNKAARVIGDATNFHDASTIHSYLDIKVVNDFRSGKTVLKKNANYAVKENTLVIIDEAGMLDNQMLKMITDSTCNCKVLFIGDQDQLVPIFEKECPVFAKDYLTVELTTVQRQTENNPIIGLTQKLKDTVRTGKFFELTEVPGFIEKVDGPTFKATVEKYFLAQEYNEQYKILAWSNDRVNEYNKHIRGLFTPQEEPQLGEIFVANSVIKNMKGAVCITNDQKIRVDAVEEGTIENIAGWFITTNFGDRVFMAKDHKEVLALLKIAESEAKAAKQWTRFFYLKEVFADLRPIYASTVHKSQGSTYDTVFIDLNDIGRCNTPNDVARMLYVAISRASKKIYLYGQLPDKYRGITYVF